MDPIKEIPLITTTEAAEASDSNTTNLVQSDDDYIGLDWNKVLRY